MILMSMGSGEMVHHSRGLYSTIRLRWVDENDSERCRIPQPVSRVYGIRKPFMAAGKRYRSLSQLLLKSPKGMPWCRDIYGREVLHLTERFPCFDSYDYMYENRYFHDLFIYEKDTLTHIAVTDEDDTFTLTEDARDVKPTVWREFQNLGYHTRRPEGGR